MTREQRREVEKKLTPAEWQRRLELIKSKWPEKLRSEYPMVCFSSEEDNLLVWAHYADGHTGIAVHFDATIVPWGAAQRVDYQHEYPNVLLPSDLDDVPRLTSRCLLTKSVSWEYEKEFRLIDYPDPQPGVARALDGIFPVIAPQTRLIPMTHITGVTIGAAMPEPLKDALVAKLAGRDPPLRIRLARLHPRAFAVVIRDQLHS